MFGKKEENTTSRIIIDEQVVSVSDLKRRARRANTRFWSLAVGMSLISSMVLPYMSLASTVAAGDSNVFQGEVVPGYSMGGINVTAYGVDVNSWGMINKDTVVGSTYGVWSGDRLDKARQQMAASGSRVILADNTISANTNLQSSDKSVGWQAITGRTGYSSDAPDGQEAMSQSNQYDVVSPYRTVNDANYWDRCKPSSSGNSSASINVSLFPDFIIVAVTETESGVKAAILESPDEIESTENNAAGLLWSPKNGVNTASAAVPYYVPLSVLFDKYGLTDPKEATIANLLDKMYEEDSDGTDLAGYAQDYNLLSYSDGSTTMLTYDVNHAGGNGQSGKSSDAFNPYPYSMVFSQDTKNGRITSSIYNNSEAYVYFSPASMYSKYIALRNEYNQIKSIADSDNTLTDIRVIVQLGYYAASMAVLEAYLDEALPQDMTRGYVGPSEPETVAASKTSENSTGDIAGDGKQKAGLVGDSAELYRKVSYATIMYDVVKQCGADGSTFKLSETNAIMDTLSVFGYAVDKVPGTGVMKGLTASEYLLRYNALTPHAESAYNTNKVEKVAQKTDSSSGEFSNRTPTGVSTSGLSEAAADAVTSEKEELINSVEARIDWINRNKGYGGYKEVYIKVDADSESYATWYKFGSYVYDPECGQIATINNVSLDPHTSIVVDGKDCFSEEGDVFGELKEYGSEEETANAMMEWDAMEYSAKYAGLDVDIATVTIPQASTGTTSTTTNIATGNTNTNKNKRTNWFGSEYTVQQGILASSDYEGPSVGNNRSGITVGKSEPDKKKAGYSGFYIPPYYPIQQHKIDQSEMQYRFAIIGAVPYDVVTQYIKQYGFASGVSLSYASGDNDASITNFTDITDAENRVAALAALYEKAENSSLAAGLYLAQVQYGNVATDEGKEMIAVYGESASGFSKDDLSIKDSENVSDEESRKVTAARIDAALLGYAASNMTADNVHDLFDVVRATVGVKMETWYRFYNPLKSEGGDTDFFVTRISPARTLYLPSVLMNGYTAAGGREISADLTTVNCSFDYYSTPSFAPCFASHTADDCYYGVLNYEQRAFYSKGFIETLSPNANIPAVELEQEMEDAIREMNSEQAKENQIMWQNVGTLYIMAKRYAYLMTVQTLVKGNGVVSTSRYLDLLKGVDHIKEQSTATTDEQGQDELTEILEKSPDDMSEAEFNKVITSTEFVNYANDNYIGVRGGGTYWWGSPEKGGQYADEKKERIYGYEVYTDATTSATGDCTRDIILSFKRDRKADAATVAQAEVNLADTETISLPPEAIKQNSQLKFSDALALVANSSDKIGHINPGFFDTEQNPFNEQDGFFIFKNGVDEADYFNKILLDGTAVEGEIVRNDVFISVLYNDQINSLLGKGGKYYWLDISVVKEKVSKIWNNLSVSPEGGGKVHKGEHNIHSAGFNASLLQGIPNVPVSPTLGDPAILSAYEETMKEASAEIGQAVINLVKDMKLLQDSMPNQMMNCLAWADYKNSADSEESYQYDPTEPNVTFNLYEQGLETYDADWIEKNGVTGVRQLDQYNVEFVPNDGDDESAGAIRVTGVGEDANGNLQSRMVRGVEGATWTSTEQLAAYSISSTIQRVQFMSNETGSVYPYSGLANGRLQSGAERYEVMQSHVIDYAALASGIKGDLSVRQRAKVVSITNPEYSSITDFLNVLGNLGALLGELGKSMLRTTSEAFSAMMFPPKNTTAATTTATQAAKSMAATMVYTTPSGITMNRLPASATTYDVNAGQMTLKPIASSSSAAMSNAAGISAVTQFGGLLLNEGHSLYAMLQTFGLTLVMVFIGFIAFRNFYAYSVSNSTGMLVGQTQLKVVLPRSILAIFMIGLPPMAAGSIGFEGGNYLVLSLISNVMEFITGIFMNLNGQAIMSVFDINMSSAFGGDIFAYLIYFLCCLVLAACFLVGVVCIFIQTLLLFGFFLVGPIAWAFYVWPYNATTDAEGNWGKGNAGGGFLTTLTQKMNFSVFTSHRAGNLAPMGLLFNYTVIAGLTVAWALIFWFISMIFVGTTFAGTSSAAASASAAIAATGYPQASAALLGSSGTDLFSMFSLSDASATYLRMLFATVIALVAFIIMTRLLINTFVDTVGFQKTIAGRAATTLKDAWNDPTKRAALAGKAADAMGKLAPVAGAAGKAANMAARTLTNPIGAAAKGVEEGKKKVDSAKKLASSVSSTAKNLPEVAKTKAQEAKDAAKKSAENALEKAKNAPAVAAAKAKDAVDPEKAKAKYEATKAEQDQKLKEKKPGRLEKMLREQSNEDNARQAIAKKKAKQAVLKNLANGDILGSVGDALGARGILKSANELAAKGAEKDLEDRALKALKDVAAGKESFDFLDEDVKQRLRALGAVDEHDNFTKAGAVKAKETLEAKSAALGQEIKELEALSEVQRDVVGAFHTTGGKTGSEVAKALAAAATPGGLDPTSREGKKHALEGVITEGSVQGVMDEYGFTEDERHDAETMVALRNDSSVREAHGNALREVNKAGNDAVAQQNALRDAQFAMDDDLSKLDSPQAKHAYVSSTYGQACSEEKYIEYQTALAQGKPLSTQAAKEVMAFEAHARIDGTVLPNALPPDRAASASESIAYCQSAFAGQDYVEIGNVGSEYRNAAGNIISIPTAVAASLNGMAGNADNMAQMQSVVMQSFTNAGLNADQIGGLIGNIGDLDPHGLMNTLVSVSSNAALDPVTSAAASMAIQGMIGVGTQLSVQAAGEQVEMLQDYYTMAASVPSSGQAFQRVATAGMSDSLLRMFNDNHVFSDAEGNAFTAQEAYDTARSLCENLTPEMCEQYGVELLDAQKFLFQSPEMLRRVAEDQVVRNEYLPMATARYGADNLRKLEHGDISFDAAMASIANLTGDSMMAYAASGPAGAAYVSRLEDSAAAHAGEAMITREMLGNIAAAHQAVATRYTDRPITDKDMRASIGALSTVAFNTEVENGFYDNIDGMGDIDFPTYAAVSGAYRACSMTDDGYAVPASVDRAAFESMVGQSIKPEMMDRAYGVFDYVVNQRLDEDEAVAVFGRGYDYYDTLRAYDICSDDLTETYFEGTNFDALKRQRTESASRYSPSSAAHSRAEAARRDYADRANSGSQMTEEERQAQRERIAERRRQARGER